MDVLEDYYGKRTFALYSLFAKVPGTSTWPRALFISFSVFVLFCCTLLQLLIMIAEKFKFEVVLGLLPTAVATGGTLVYIPYVTFASREQYKAILAMMLHDLKLECSEAENDIIRWYAKQARFITNASTLIFALAMSGMPLSGFLQGLLDALAPLNETRRRQLLVSTETLIDEDIYFYLLYLFQCSNVIVVCTVVGVSENMAVIIGHHFCCMVAILGHRLQNLTNRDPRSSLDDATYNRLVRSRLRVCVKGHQRVLRFAFVVAAFYDIPLTLILTGTFSALTVSLVQATDPKLTNTTVVFFATTQILQLFILSYMGQSGMDASESVAVNVYNANWDICQPRMRKSMLLMILRASKPCLVVARGMYMLCLQNFMAVMQTVTSFYMVLRQTY